MYSVTRCDDGRFVNEAPDFLGSFGTAAEAIDAARRAVDLDAESTSAENLIDWSSDGRSAGNVPVD